MRIINLLLKRYRWLGSVLVVIIVFVAFKYPDIYTKGANWVSSQIIQNTVARGEGKVKALSGIVEQMKKNMNLK